MSQTGYIKKERLEALLKNIFGKDIQVKVSGECRLTCKRNSNIATFKRVNDRLKFEADRIVTDVSAYSLQVSRKLN